MPLRKLLLRTLFWSLGLAAALGALGVLSASNTVVWRIVGTCILTAGGALLLLLASRWIDRAPARPAALLAATLIVAEYLISLGLIWELPGPFQSEERTFMTLLWLFLCGVPAIALLRLTRSPAARIAAWVGLGICAVNLVLLLVGTWLDSNSIWTSYSEKWIGSASALACFGLLAILCLVGVGVDRHHWRWLGVFASALGLLIAIYVIVYDIPSTGSPLFVAIVCSAAVVAHANVMVRVPLSPMERPLRWGTIAAAAATGALVVAIEATKGNYGLRAMLERLAGASSIIAGCGTLALLVLARINRRSDAPATLTLTDLREIALICPHCRRRQIHLIGAPSPCQGCGLLLQIHVSEPRCPTCNYSLMMLKSERCPECGTAVPRVPTLAAAT